MEKAQKERLVEELTERLQQSTTLLVADYRGLSMSEIDALRTEVLKHGATLRVVKNTLTRRAAEAAGQDALLALLEGPTAIAFLESDGDPVAVAKALEEASRTTKILAIRGGLLEGRPISEQEISELAKLPAAEVLRGQVLGAILGPLNAIAGLINAPLQNLYGLIDARIEQLERAGDTSASPDAAAEPQAAATEAKPAAHDAPAEEPQAAAAEEEAPVEEAPVEEPQASADAATAEGEAEEDVAEPQQAAEASTEEPAEGAPEEPEETQE